MDPKMKKGIGFVKTGLKVVKGGQRALLWGKRLKKLPPLRKKALQKAERKALKKEEKHLRHIAGKKKRREQRHMLCRNAKGLSSVALALRKKYL